MDHDKLPDIESYENRSYFTKKTGILEIFSPYTILKRKNIEFNKDFLHSFRNYVQAMDEYPPNKKIYPEV